MCFAYYGVVGQAGHIKEFVGGLAVVVVVRMCGSKVTAGKVTKSILSGHVSNLFISRFHLYSCHS